LTFDIPDSVALLKETQTQIHVIAGGPCSGKTTLLRALEQAGHRVEVETAERMLEAGIAAGRTAEELRADPVQWQQEVLQKDYDLFDGLSVNERVFTDTSFLETVVFGRRAGITIGPNIKSWLHHKRYKVVFFLEPLEAYEQSAVRLESRRVAMQISSQVRACYQVYGYEPVAVPSASVSERVAFIESRLDLESYVKTGQ
jgi:predicted ATPase